MKMDALVSLRDMEIARLKDLLKKTDAELSTARYRIAAKDDEIAKLRQALSARRRVVYPGNQHEASS